MIKRELYMKRIRPFIGNDLIKVMTGVRRAGKSVMLELVQEELLKQVFHSRSLFALILRICNMHIYRQHKICTVKF